MQTIYSIRSTYQQIYEGRQRWNRLAIAEMLELHAMVF